MNRTSGYDGPGELVGYGTNIRIYELDDGRFVMWNAAERREATDEELQDPFMQSVLADVTDRGEWPT